MNDVQKSTKRETKTKSFVKKPTKNSRASKIARLLLYKPKVFLRRDWFGLCENSHNAKAKKIKNIFQIWLQNA